MIISSENLKKYNDMNMDVNKLKVFYIQEAKYLLKNLLSYKDKYSLELIKILKEFVKNPIKDLSDMINEIKANPRISEWNLNNFKINDTLFNIFYPEPEWMDEIR